LGANLIELATGGAGMLRVGNRRSTAGKACAAEWAAAQAPVLNFFIERYTEACKAAIDHSSIAAIRGRAVGWVCRGP
jgi:hypothetical protein